MINQLGLNMPPEGSIFTTLNLPREYTLPRYMEYFTLTAGPNTDLWRKPPNGDTSTAPIVFTSLRYPFVVAEVTVTADWEMEWDQGGLVIFAGAAPQSFSHTRNFTSTRHSRPPIPCKWVKAGIEFSSGAVHASSVSATSDGADWCLSPLNQPDQGPGIQSLRIKFERIGHALWVWYQVQSSSPFASTPRGVGSTWRKLREVNWFFYGVEDKCVHVGVYGSRPISLGSGETMYESMQGLSLDRSLPSGPADGLVVEFEDLEIF